MKQGRSEDNQESKRVTTVKMNALNANLVHLDMEVAIPFWRGGGVTFKLSAEKFQKSSFTQLGFYFVHFYEISLYCNPNWRMYQPRWVLKENTQN